MAEGRRIDMGKMALESERVIGEISADEEGVFQNEKTLGGDMNRPIAPLFVGEDGRTRGDLSTMVERKDTGHEYPVATVDQQTGEPAQFVLREGVMGEPIPSREVIENLPDLSGPIRPVLVYDEKTGRKVSITTESRIPKKTDILSQE